MPGPIPVLVGPGGNVPLQPHIGPGRINAPLPVLPPPPIQLPVVRAMAMQALAQGQNATLIRQVMRALEYAVPQLAAPNVTTGTLQGWYKADSLAASLNDGDSVSTWADSSGLGHDATQATGANQPTFRASQQNGLPAVVFDGVNDVLSATIASTVQPFTVFIVAQAASTDTDVLISNSSADAIVYFIGNTDMYLYCGVAGNGLHAPSGTPDISTWRYLTAQANGTSSRIRVDGSQIAAGDVGTNNFGTGLTIGAEPGSVDVWPGSIGEILFYSGALSDADVASVEAYLAAKWFNQGFGVMDQVVGWYKADSLVAANGDSVATWPDSSGNGHDATQATGANQPTFNTNQVNGLPAVTFNGTTDFLTATLAALNQPYTVFLVSKNVSGTSYALLSSPTTMEMFFDNLEVGIYGGANLLTATAGPANGTWSYTTGVYNGTSSVVRSNGTQVVAGNASTNSFGTTLDIGGNGVSMFNGPIAEVVIVSGALSTADILEIEGYLAAKWGFSGAATGPGQQQSATLAVNKILHQALSASQAQTDGLVRRVARIAAASQSQSNTSGRALTRSLGGSQGQTATALLGLSRTLAATGQSQTVTQALQVSRKLAASQSQAGTLVTHAGHSVTVSATQGQSATAILAITRGFSGTQNQSATSAAGLSRTMVASQAQTPAQVLQLRRAILTTQGQSGTFARSLPRVFQVTQTQAGTIVRAVTRNLAASQSQTGSLVVHIPPRNVILTATQAQSAAAGRALSRSFPATQAQSDAASRALARSLAASQAQSATAAKGLSRTLAGTQGQSATAALALSKPLLVSQGQAPGQVLQVRRVAVGTQGQTGSLLRLVPHPLPATQAQSASLIRQAQRASTATQAQVAVALKQGGFVVSTSQGQSGAFVRAVRRTLPGSGQSQTSSTLRASFRALAATQSQSATQQLQVGRGLTAAQSQLASLSFGYNLIFSVAQSQSPALRRAVSRSFSSTQAQTDLLLVSLIQNLPPADFPADAHLRAVASDARIFALGGSASIRAVLSVAGLMAQVTGGLLRTSTSVTGVKTLATDMPIQHETTDAPLPTKKSDATINE